jgi:ABC-type oligopeptide transport system substrate-binding subunit
MKKLLLASSFLVLVFGLAACGSEPSVPSISGTGNATIEVGQAFDPRAGVSAADSKDGDLTADIQVSGSVNTAVAGTYTLTYSVTNSDGESVSRTRTVTVRAAAVVDPGLGDFVLANGIYDFKFAPIDLKHLFFAAGEKYLLENQIGGIPLWASSSFTLFSSRMQLPTDSFDPVMGFGIAFGSMSQDDSNVIMDSGRPGNAREFTYRVSIGNSPATLNQWLAQDSVSSDVIGTFLDGLYYFGYNSDFSGFEVKPSMASAMPTPVDSTVVFGTTVSNVWSVPVRAGLRWTYNAGTDTSAFPAGHEAINAQSFVDTYKLAVDQGWFRAISGGGDFLSATQRIKNMREYIDGDVEWSEVGIRAEGNNIVFEFIPQMSEWNVIYWLSGFTLTPINMALYDSVGAQYGTSATTTAYNGRFFIETYEADRIIRLKRNPNFWEPSRNFYTGYTFEIIADPNIAFQSFLAGRLDAAGLTAARFNEFQTFPGIRFAPGATVFRMNLNSMGSVENQREEWPDGTWIPEPILQYPDFHKALYFGADRETLAYDVQRTAEPAMYYFTPAYLVDPAGGVSFRGSQFGPSVLENLSPDTSGFNPDASTAFFRSAVRQAVADGHYAQGEVIRLHLGIQADSPGSLLGAEFLKESYERLFTDPETGITVVINIVPEPFPNNYFNVILPGEFDMGFGGISGSQLNAASFFNIFRSGPGRSPFVLNFGPSFDTEEPVIRIEYVDPVSGETKREIFSFSAIYYLLTSEAEIVDGVIIYD